MEILQPHCIRRTPLLHRHQVMAPHPSLQLRAAVAQLQLLQGPEGQMVKGPLKGPEPTDGPTDRRTDGQIDGQTERQSDGRTD